MNPVIVVAAWLIPKAANASGMVDMMRLRFSVILGSYM